MQTNPRDLQSALERRDAAMIDALAGQPAAVTDGHRAALLQREVEALRRLNALLLDQLIATADELSRVAPEHPQVRTAQRTVALARVG